MKEEDQADGNHITEGDEHDGIHCDPEAFVREYA